MALELTDTPTLRESLVSPVLTLAVATWNLQGTLPPIKSLQALAQSSHFHHHPSIIFFATQECQRSLWLTCCLESKSEWESMLEEAFPSYSIKWAGAMRGLHSAVLVRKGEEKEVEVDRVDKVRSGAGGTMGTKGAIAVTIAFKGVLLQIINCHLASGQHESPRRTSSLQTILQKLGDSRAGCQMIVLGDLNYRLEVTTKEYLQLLAELKGKLPESYSHLTERDQFRLQEGAFKDVLEERQINFPPTYKLHSQESRYCETHIFGWTDRILFRSSGLLSQLSYECEHEVMGSDHRPVLARFERAVDGEVGWKDQGEPSRGCCLLM